MRFGHPIMVHHTLFVGGPLLATFFAATSCEAAAHQERQVDVAIIGAGYAGLSAANYLHKRNVSFFVLEANTHVGGRTRNFDLARGEFDVISDSVLEVGGTFVSPGHTALIELVQDVGLELFNTSGSGSGTKRYRGARFQAKTLPDEPADAWPWWWFGVDTESSMLRSTFHSFNRSFAFSTPSELRKQMDVAVLAELDASGKLLDAAAKSIDCTGAFSKQAWGNLDSTTFEAWIRDHVSEEEGRVVLRAMCRGMIAQEPSQVSLLYTVRSLKGCWSTGDDEQFRIRGGSQAPLLRLWRRFSKQISLNAPVVSITSSTSKGFPLHVETKSDSGISVMAKHVVLTGPPPTVLGINVPSLSWADAQLLQRMPMGTSLKYSLVYKTPWWRTEQGLSGQIIATKMPTILNASQAEDGFTSCMEHSAYDGLYKHGKGVLMCWIEGECNLHFLSTLSKSQRQEHVIAFLEVSFQDPRLRNPERVIEHNWASQPYSRGAYTSFFPPGVQSEPAFWHAFSTAEKSQGLWIAGSDYQLGFGNGYMEGAVRSGQSVAAAITEKLQNMPNQRGAIYERGTEVTV